MSKAPQLWIVAGPNGAGKTTCVQKEPIASLLPNVPFLNPDDITRAKLIASGYTGFADAPLDVQTKLFFESADQVQEDLEQAINNGNAIGVETVLSSDKYQSLVNRVIELNGQFRLIYITLRSPAISIERVAARVRRGGHGVPEDKIEARFYRSHSNLTWFARRDKSFWVIDNSDSHLLQPPKMLAHGSQGKLSQLDPSAPEHLIVAFSTFERSNPAPNPPPH